MCRMAPLLGGDLSRRVFLDRFGALSGDRLFHVRKICAANFGEFCSVVGQQVTENSLVRNKNFFMFYLFTPAHTHTLEMPTNLSLVIKLMMM